MFVVIPVLWLVLKSDWRCMIDDKFIFMGGTLGTFDT